MINLTSDLAKITELRTQALNLEMRKQSILGEVEDKTKLLRQELIAGKATTGDPIKDFVLVRYGSLDEEVEKTYRELEAEVEAHVGQLTLIICRSEHLSGCHGFGQRVKPEDYLISTELYLGVLKGKKFVFDLEKETCHLPFGEQIYRTSLHSGKWESNETSRAFMHRVKFEKRDKPLDIENPRHEGTISLQVIIGNEAVEKFFGDGRYRRTFEEVRDKLIPPPSDFVA
jgi:hypothetical protein